MIAFSTHFALGIVGGDVLADSIDFLKVGFLNEGITIWRSDTSKLITNNLSRSHKLLSRNYEFYF